MPSLRCTWTAVVAVVTMAAATPARANWQYTQWGMSPDQVKLASDGTARDNGDRKLDADGVKATLTAPYEGAALPFTAVFLFDARDRLEYVTLNPIGQISCPVVLQALSANHGTPTGTDDMVHASTRRWDDVENDNLVVFLDLGQGNCSIQYSKLPNTQPRGRSL